MAAIRVHRIRALGVATTPKNTRVRVHRIAVRLIISSSHYRYNGTTWVPLKVNIL